MTPIELKLFKPTTLMDAAAVIELLDRGASPNSKNSLGQTALHFAAAGGFIDTMKALISRGARVNAYSRNRYTPLHMACARNIESAGTIEAVALLIAHQANVNAKTSSGMAPLHIAARNGHKACCRLLIEDGPSLNINARDLEGKTALKWAAMSGQMDIALLLIAHGAQQKDGPQKIRNLKISELTDWQAAIKGGLMKEVGQSLDWAFGVADAENEANNAKDPKTGVPLVRTMASYARKVKQMDVLALIQSRTAMRAIDGAQKSVRPSSKPT